jgi:hypothetical protein
MMANESNLMASPTNNRRVSRNATTSASSRNHNSNITTSPSRRTSSLLMTAAEAFQAASHSPMDTHNTTSMRRAAKELMGVEGMRSRRFIVDTRTSEDNMKSPPLIDDEDDDDETRILLVDEVSSTNGYGSVEAAKRRTSEHMPFLPKTDHSTETEKGKSTTASFCQALIQQTSAVAVVALLNMMISIPFGASYFPIGWRAEGGGEDDDDTDADDVHGVFPIAGKQALGIRMFLFATLVGQLAFTVASKFTNPVGMQMVENVPFLHALCHTVIQQQGYGKEALSTVFFLFGFSSVIVGIVFYTLGKLELGRIVYFFPNHVLVGCIGGIGIFIVITAMEVTNDVTFSFDMDGIRGIVDNFHLLSVVLGFEVTLRVLMIMTQDKQGRAKYPLLSPIYYCMITPLLYLGLLVFGVSMERATEQGYFFPSSEEEPYGSSSVWQDPHLWDIFSVIDLTKISWMAVFHSTGTMIALAAFSLIHVPISKYKNIEER